MLAALSVAVGTPFFRSPDHQYRTYSESYQYYYVGYRKNLYAVGCDHLFGNGTSHYKITYAWPFDKLEAFSKTHLSETYNSKNGTWHVN